MPSPAMRTALSKEVNWARSSTHPKQFVTRIPVHYINPGKLENVLSAKFQDDFEVEMSRNYYRVTASHQLAREDVQRCY